jgi:hypothetical protein
MLLKPEEWFEVDFQKIGISPVSVKADSGIEIMAKVKMDGYMRFHYGYNGYNPEEIEGQDFDFTMDRAESSNNTNKDFGQFPFILYAK